LRTGASELVDYQRIGVKPFINARGNSTANGGSIMPPEVVAAAVEVFLGRTDAEDHADWQARIETVVAALDGSPGVNVSIAHDGALTHPAFAPRARVEIDDPCLLERVGAAMLAGDQPIRLGSRPGVFFVDPMTLQPGEAEIVGQRLRMAVRS
jgi:hypothetical protein